MIKIVEKTVLVDYIVAFVMHLKWAWGHLLRQSLNVNSVLPGYIDDFNATCCKRDIADLDESVECAVCLCKIDEDDEVRELRCQHLFHRVCLDRWLGCGGMTCPLCRNSLKTPPFAAAQEVVFFDFCDTSGGRDRWWLR